MGKLFRSQHFHDTDRFKLYIFEGSVSTILWIGSQLAIIEGYHLGDPTNDNTRRRRSSMAVLTNNKESENNLEVDDIADISKCSTSCESLPVTTIAVPTPSRLIDSS